MSYTSTPDINVIITVIDTTSSTNPSLPSYLVRTERRINPTWTISHLKSKLEPITGIPSSSQHLQLQTDLTTSLITLTPDTASVGATEFSIHKNSEIRVTDLRPVGARQNFTDVSSVDKYEMPVEQYEKLDDSVLAWKRKQRLGRFDPHAKSLEELEGERRRGDGRIVVGKGIEVGKRCRVGGEDERRGVVRFVGEIEGLGGEKERGCVWVGVEVDEPVGRNDGTVKVDVGGGKTEVKRVFECKDKFGVFARPEKIEIGDWPPLDDFDEDMEEI